MKTRKYRWSGLWFFVLFALSANCASGGADLRAKYDICFIKDYPGASNRYVEYTPVRCTNKSVVLGAAVGGEFASLDFEDTDADGVSEIVVSSEFWCRWGFEPCIAPTRTIVKISGAQNTPQFTIVRVDELPPSPEFR